MDKRYKSLSVVKQRFQINNQITKGNVGKEKYNQIQICYNKEKYNLKEEQPWGG